MIKIYDQLCVDVITKSKESNNGKWKFQTMMFLSAFLSVLFMAIIITLKKILPEGLNYSIYSENYVLKRFEINIEALLLYFLPPLIINYFILLFNKRYEKILLVYKPKNGKYMLRFMVISLLSFMVSLFL
ncbi:hypothetical protein HYN56_19735 [Flavobacterium crocinum]|uniref:Uncharacterized protein n=1 Tax=Flavobacterium crocinum TaxID=2183896 RepID=A0A2S1YQI0_9FLAO|nr:hypothetical protein [Flavobacterium crocinum]AWK06335.1 hypothetical protein HYN56_19735 [Flavobacterium crocinum]